MSKVPQNVAGAIAAKITDWEPTNGQIAYLLNHEMHPNPTPCPNVQRTVYSMELMSLVNMSRVPALVSHPRFADVRHDIKTQDIPALLEWPTVFYVLGMITAVEKQALEAYIATPIPDPNYQEEISWSLLTFGREIDEEDVAAAREAVN